MLFKDDENSDVNVEDEIRIVTGNWGCGAFGGDPEIIRRKALKTYI